MYYSAYTYKNIPDLGFRPNVSVIIPVKNEEEVIEHTIRAILDSDYPSEKLNVIVVDDGSTDKTVDKIEGLIDELKSDRITFIKHKRNHGKCVALATGANNTTNDIIVCIDSDSFVDKDAIKLLVQPLVNKEIVAVCGHGKAHNKDKNMLTMSQHFWYQEMFFLTKSMESRYDSVTCCPGILSAYKKEVVCHLLKEWLIDINTDKLISEHKELDEHRELNRSILYKLLDKLAKCVANSKADDSTLTLTALSDKEAKIVYQSNAVVYTMVPETFGQFVKQQLRWNRAYIYGILTASKFIWKKPFPVPIYFYIYQLLAYISPVVVFVWLIIRPISGDLVGSTDFLLGTLYIGFLHGVNISRYDENPSSNIIDSAFYRTIFVFVSMILSISVLPYAWITAWKGGWMTRGDRNVK